MDNPLAARHTVGVIVVLREIARKINVQCGSVRSTLIRHISDLAHIRGRVDTREHLLIDDASAEAVRELRDPGVLNASDVSIRQTVIRTLLSCPIVFEDEI